MAKSCSFDFTHSIRDDSMAYPMDNLLLLSRKMSIHVLNACKGYLMKFQSDSGTEFEYL